MTQRIGLLGGTFDPLHVGHLWLGETARDQLALDEVWFLPVGCPPHKTEQTVTAVSHRLAMTQLATAPFPHFTVSRADIDRPLPHTTCSLLTYLHQQHPQVEFWLIIGADSLQEFSTWENPNEILKRCRLAVLGREDIKIEWERLETAVSNIRASIDWLDGPTLTISGTQIRAWAQAGQSIQHLVQTAVYDYIHRFSLYNSIRQIPRIIGNL